MSHLSHGEGNFDATSTDRNRVSYSVSPRQGQDPDLNDRTVEDKRERTVGHGGIFQVQQDETSPGRRLGSRGSYSLRDQYLSTGSVSVRSDRVRCTLVRVYHEDPRRVSGRGVLTLVMSTKTVNSVV